MMRPIPIPTRIVIVCAEPGVKGSPAMPYVLMLAGLCVLSLMVSCVVL